MQGTAQDIGIEVVTMTFAQFSARVIEILREAQDAPDVPDRIIALSKLRAACTDHMGEIGPQQWSAYGAMMSKAVQSAKKKTQATKKVDAKSKMLF
jgi:hypothetical protein